MFYGTWNTRIADRNRIRVPRSLVNQIKKGKELIIERSQRARFRVYPFNKRNIKQVSLERIRIIRLDSQERIWIPQYMVSRNIVGKRVTLKGKGDYFEIILNK